MAGSEIDAETPPIQPPQQQKRQEQQREFSGCFCLFEVAHEQSQSHRLRREVDSVRQAGLRQRRTFGFVFPSVSQAITLGAAAVRGSGHVLGVRGAECAGKF